MDKLVSSSKNRIKKISTQHKKLLLQNLICLAEKELPSIGDYDYDVVVMGGGLAGLTIARQLKQACSTIRIVVLEKNAHPVPEAAFKVGESSVEIGASYLYDRLDLKDMLTTRQLPKAGLRFFFTQGQNDNIAKRVEMGPTYFPPIPSFQLDRGRFENDLRELNVKEGIDFKNEMVVKNIHFDSRGHTIETLHKSKLSKVTCRWLVDASGRASLLKRELGLEKKTDHKAHAAWFRLSSVIDPSDWSSDISFTSRGLNDLRRFSTNHFMGRGYWVWIIPLASGSTSIGIVVDGNLHPLKKISKFERVLKWLTEHEPQLCEVVKENRETLQDFLVLGSFTHDCTRVYSQDRWYLTGDAGVFLDPFYSPGSDFIAISNSFIVDIISREYRNESVRDNLELYNRIYLGMFQSFLNIYKNQYKINGNALVMMAKIVWDTAAYWGITAVLYFHGKLTDFEFISVENVVGTQHRLTVMNSAIQGFLNHWCDHCSEPNPDVKFVDYLEIDFLRNFHYALMDECDDKEVAYRLKYNIQFIREIGLAIFNSAEQLLTAPLDPNRAVEFREAFSKKNDCGISISDEDKKRVFDGLTKIGFRFAEQASV